jgi:hypothetical protein
MLRELASGYWSHKPCQGIQDREVACCCWVVYIGIGPRIGAKGGVNGGPTMVGPDAMTRACYYRRRCCHCLPPPPPPPEAGPGYMLMVPVQGLLKEGQDGGAGLGLLPWPLLP